MKNLWLLIAALLILSACSGSSHSKNKVKRNYSSTHKTKYKGEAKYSYRLKPSESMQAGIYKKHYLVAKDKENKVAPSLANIVDSQYSENSTDIVKNDGQYVGHYKIGDPYQVFGVSYFPQNYEDYEETGMASWYGDDFHGKPTANGETYDSESMTAAHPTLPLPSMVRVTNLRNGKSVIVRVNDRGPFAKSRIIDVSEMAADRLEFKDHGTTEVKIELLRNDTDELLQKLKVKN